MALSQRAARKHFKSAAEENERYNLRQKTGNPEQLASYAEMSLSTLDTYTRQLAEAITSPNDTLPAEFSGARIKDPLRTLEKGNNKHGGDCKLVLDVAAARLKVNTPAQLEKVLKIFGPGLNTDPFHKVHSNVSAYNLENNFEQPKRNGHVQANMNLKVDLGKGREVVVELQILVGGLEKACKLSEESYHEVREYYDRIEKCKKDIKTEKRSKDSSATKIVRLKEEIDTYQACVSAENERCIAEYKLGLVKLAKQGQDFLKIIDPQRKMFGEIEGDQRRFPNRYIQKDNVVPLRNTYG
jgi:hypothetical protein